MAVKWGGRGFGHTSRWALAAASVGVSQPISAVDSTGWQATMPTPVDLALSAVSVSRQGYTSAGATTTYTETLYTTKRVRQPYPNQASLTTNTVALSDYVYSTDTLSGVTNSSAEASPQPVANWAMVDRRVVGNSLPLEVVAFHRNGVACVEFRATDGTNTVTSVVSSLSISGATGDQFPVLVYAATLDITSLTDNANITVNAKVFPRIGAAASINDSANGTAARSFSPRTFRKNTSRAAAPFLVYVSSTGNDTTGAVSQTEATAAASPVLTLNGAFSRARTVLGTTAGSLDGLEIRLTEGTWTLSANPTANTVNAAVTITNAPGAAKANTTYSTGGGNFHCNCTYIRWKGITFLRANAFSIFSTAGGHYTVEDVAFNNNSQTSATGSTANTGGYWFGVTLSNYSGTTTTIGPGTLEIRMLRGVVGGTANNSSAFEGYLVLSSHLTGVRAGYGARGTSGLIIAFNRFSSMGSSAGPTFSTDQANDNTVNAAFVQNVWEYTSSTSNTMISNSADSGANDTTHCIMWHNTFAGYFTYGRNNILYNETSGDPRTHKLNSFVGNLHVQINTKHDIFCGANLGLPDASTRIGGWSYLYGVGCRNEFSRYQDAATGTFSQEYAGIGSSLGTASSGAGNDPLFTSYAATTTAGAAGAGGGTYTLQTGSPAKSFVTDSPVPIDFAGNTRTGTVSAGAYA